MSQMSVGMERARRAQLALEGRLLTEPVVNGIGISRVAGGYGVQVNLSEQAPGLEIPPEVDGVPVSVSVVGPIVAQ